MIFGPLGAGGGGEGSKIQTGSYNGSGSTSRSITFDFPPKAVIVIESTQFTPGSRNGFIWVGQPGDPESSYKLGFSLAGNRLTWSGTNELDTLNTKGLRYYYIAFG